MQPLLCIEMVELLRWPGKTRERVPRTYAGPWRSSVLPSATDKTDMVSDGFPGRRYVFDADGSPGILNTAQSISFLSELETSFPTSPLGLLPNNQIPSSLTVDQSETSNTFGNPSSSTGLTPLDDSCKVSVSVSLSESMYTASLPLLLVGS